MADGCHGLRKTAKFRSAARNCSGLAQLADRGLGEEFIAMVGMEAAARTGIAEDRGYNPFANCDEARREWLLFCLYGVARGHIEWLLQRPFGSPDEWLGEAGQKCRKTWRISEPPEAFVQGWAAFRATHNATPLAEIETALGSTSSLKSAMVADLGGAVAGSPRRRPVSRTPIDAETKGQLQMVGDGGATPRGLSPPLSREIGKLAAAFAKPSGKGRGRAWLGLQRVFRDVASLERVDLDGRDPMALWAVLHPREAALVYRPDRPLTPGERQPSIGMDLFNSGDGASTGLWSAEVPLHALGRVMQRDRRADPDKILLDLHHGLLRVQLAALTQNPEDDLLVRAGEGAFVIDVIPSADVQERSRKFLLIRATTLAQSRHAVSRTRDGG